MDGVAVDNDDKLDLLSLETPTPSLSTNYNNIQLPYSLSTKHTFICNNSTLLPWDV